MLRRYSISLKPKTDLKSGFPKINRFAEFGATETGRSVRYFRPWSEYYLSTRLPWFSIFPFVSLLWIFTVVLIEWNHDWFFPLQIRLGLRLCLYVIRTFSKGRHKTLCSQTYSKDHPIGQTRNSSC